MGNSRECPEGLKLLKENKIELIAIPSHCSHLLQPCDLGIFFSFKMAIKKYKYEYLNITLNYKGEKSEVEKISENDIQRIKLYY